jgi:Tol biopolymer transport system component
MKHNLFIVVLFAFSFSGLRAQDHIPQAKKIMGLFNEESSWSPDGKTIAFDSSRPGKTSIFTWNIINADGTDIQQITQLHGRNTSPKRSPDGEKNSFDHAAQGECDIFLVHAPKN